MSTRAPVNAGVSDTVEPTTATVVKALVAVMHVLAAMTVGVVTWIGGFVAGVWADVIGLMWYDPDDYPHEDAWLAGTCVLAVFAAALTWWLLHKRARSHHASVPEQEAAAG
jgi:hypothetical protein